MEDGGGGGGGGGRGEGGNYLFSLLSPPPFFPFVPISARSKSEKCKTPRKLALATRANRIKAPSAIKNEQLWERV